MFDEFVFLKADMLLVFLTTLNAFILKVTATSGSRMCLFTCIYYSQLYLLHDLALVAVRNNSLFTAGHNRADWKSSLNP